MVYATIGARDLAEALVFYDAVMATIGWRRHADFPTSSAYSLDGSCVCITVRRCMSLMFAIYRVTSCRWYIAAVELLSIFPS